MRDRRMTPRIESRMARRISHGAIALCVAFGGALNAGAQSFGEKVSRQMQDATLVTVVSMRVQYHRALLLEKVEIAAEHGVVTLSGRISNQAAIDTAVKLASQVNGVKQVVNQMTIGRREPDHAVITPP